MDQNASGKNRCNLIEYYDRMKDTVFITGGSGLLALNWAVAIRDQYSVVLGLYDRDVSLMGVKTRYTSFESVDELLRVFEKLQPKIVIHTAGLTNVEACEANPDLARHINSDLSFNIAQTCAKLNLQLVHISTDHLFSGSVSLVNEEYPTNPKNVYGRTKAEAESRVLEAHPSALVIRTNFYGWGPSYRQSFSDTIIQSLRTGSEISLFKDVYYTPILAETLAREVHELINIRAKGIFNVVGNERMSKYEFGLRIVKQFQLNVKLIKPVLLGDKPELVQRPHDLSLSNRKTSDLVGRDIGNINDDIETLCQQERLGIAQEIQKI